jgi:hypothetical protein
LTLATRHIDLRHHLSNGFSINPPEITHMITLPQSVLRDCHAVFRRVLPRSSAVKAAASFRLAGGPDGTRLQLLQPDVGVEYLDPDSSEKVALTLPLDVLSDCQGGSSGMVHFQPLENGSILVRWEHAGAPHHREYSPRESTPNSFPAWPGRGGANEPSLVDALDQAMLTAGDSSPRLALNSIQLRGTQGDIVGTDGRQLLLQGGFRFPWKGSLLVPRTPVFAAKELCTKDPVHVAQSEAHLLFRTGCWTIALRIDESARFPNVDSVIPKIDPDATHWSIGEEEAAVLTAHLPYLPAADEDCAPVTIDLARQVAIRARGEKEERCSEVTLPDSRVAGEPTRIATHRHYLQRALKLGFRSFQITDPAKPILCQEGKSLYVWVPLDPKGALAPQPHGLRVTLPSPQKNGGTTTARSKSAVQTGTIPDVAVAKAPGGIGTFLQGARGLWCLVRKHHQQDQSR